MNAPTCGRRLGGHTCTLPAHERTERLCRDETPGRMPATWILNATSWRGASQ